MGGKVLLLSLRRTANLSFRPIGMGISTWEACGEPWSPCAGSPCSPHWPWQWPFLGEGERSRVFHPSLSLIAGFPSWSAAHEAWARLLPYACPWHHSGSSHFHRSRCCRLHTHPKPQIRVRARCTILCIPLGLALLCAATTAPALLAARNNQIGRFAQNLALCMLNGYKGSLESDKSNEKVSSELLTGIDDQRNGQRL